MKTAFHRLMRCGLSFILAFSIIAAPIMPTQPVRAINENDMVIRGTVKDDMGDTLPAEIWYYFENSAGQQNGSVRAYADGSGGWYFPPIWIDSYYHDYNLEGWKLIVKARPSYKSSKEGLFQQEVPMAPGTTVNLDIVFTTHGTVNVHITDESGNPAPAGIPYWFTYVLPDTGGANWPWNAPFDGITPEHFTDNNGTITLVSDDVNNGMAFPAGTRSYGGLNQTGGLRYEASNSPIGLPIQPGQTTDLTIAVKPLGKITARAKDSGTGQPVASARFDYSSISPAMNKYASVNDGELSIYANGDLNITASRDSNPCLGLFGYDSASATVTPTPWGEVNIDLIMTRQQPATILGQVKDREGNPFPGAAVELIWPENIPDFGEQLTTVMQTTTAADGSYSFTGVIPSGNGAYRVRASVPDYIPAMENEVAVSSGGTATVPDLQLTRDNEPPTWYSWTKLSASPGRTSIQLQWGDAQDNVAVTGYRVYQGDALLDTVSGKSLSYRVTGLTPETQYTFKVEAGDAVGNWSTTGPSLTKATLTPYKADEIIQRVSVSSDGIQANSNSDTPAASSNGNYLVFSSYADNLVPDDSNGRSDIFVFERLTGETQRVSISTYGVEGNGNSTNPAISGDGRYVAFESGADNLVTGDNNRSSDIFLHDLQTGITSRISVSAAGVEGNRGSYTPSVSADGRYIAFASYAENLVAGDSNGNEDIIVCDRLTGENEIVSKASDGTQGSGYSESPSISSDGNFVAFQSSSKLVSNDSNYYGDIYVHNRLTHTTELISVSVSGSAGNGYSYYPSISDDGRNVSFESRAGNLVSGDTNGYCDIFVRDRTTGATDRINVSAAGTQADSNSYNSSISSNGRYVAFESGAANLIPDDTNSSTDVFVYDSQTGELLRVSVSASGSEADRGRWSPAISGNGSCITYVSDAANLVGGDANNTSDSIFIYDLLGAPPADTTAPAWPGSSLTAFNVGQTSLTIKWTTATDDVGVAGYRLYKDGNLAATVSGTVYTLSSLSAGTAYTFKVEAGDAAGNWSTDGPSVTITTAGIINESITVSNPSSTGFTVALNPALPGLSGSDFLLKDDQTNSVSVIWATTSDTGTTYTISAALTAGKTYTVTAEKIGYSFGTMDVVVPAGPISDLACTGKTGTTASFCFTAPVGATAVKVQQSTDGGTTWTDSSAGDLTADSKTATVTGLTSNTAYKFKLVVIGGSRPGDSNIVDVRTNAGIIMPLAAGNASGYAVKWDGTVWAWGENGYGQLGNNSTSDSHVPVQVFGLTGVTAIAAGEDSGYALRSDGTVWAWGRNDFGQLGNNTATDSNVPVQVYGLTGVIALAGGHSSGYAVKSDGTVWAWGSNSYGALGNNSTSNSRVPVQVSGLAGVTAIAAGFCSGYALKSDGTVWAWGYNNYGQMGNNSYASKSLIPEQVSGLAGVIAIAAGENSGYALKSDGTVWAWGANLRGQLGDNSTTDSRVPVQVSGLTGITAIAAGEASGYALKSDGTVRAWGGNSGGQLGDNSTGDNRVPVQVSGLTDILAIAAGDFSGYALRSDGTVWAWGYNDSGQLGNNSTADTLVPVQVSGLVISNQPELALISDFTCTSKTQTTADFSFTAPVGATAVKVQQSANGGANWTDSVTGLLSAYSTTATVTGLTQKTTYKFKLVVTGDTYAVDSNVVDVTTDTAAMGIANASLAAGRNFGYALNSDGTVWAWGNNDYGQLGNNSTGGRQSPVQVSGLTGVTAITGGTQFGCAVKYDGTVWAWGHNDRHQLGTDLIAESNVPLQLSGLHGVTAIAAGFNAGYALKSDGTFWAWGGNDSGQLGNNSTADSHVPVQVKDSNGNGLTGVTAVAAGLGSAYALKSDGTVMAWGRNDSGQLGNNSTADSHVPVQVSGLDGVTAIASGFCTAYALKADGTVWAWGLNNSGQLGNNTTADSHVPVLVKDSDGNGLTGVIAIAAQEYSGYALKSDGTVWAWGANYYGQLGNNSTAKSHVPVQVSGLTGVTVIAAGGNSGYALKSDGTVWAWGDNYYGQLGNDSLTNSHVPVQVSWLVIGTKPLNITTTAKLPPIMIGRLYSFTLSASGGVPPYTWSAMGLPAGLSIDNSMGVISGIPTAPETATELVTVTVYDSIGTSASKNFSVEVNPVSSGTGSGDDNTTSSGTPITPGASTDGRVNITVKPQLDIITGTAATQTDFITLTSAFNLAKEDDRGNKTVEVHLPKVEGANAYELTVPASFLSIGDKTKMIDINTDIATVTVSTNMLTTVNTADAKEVSLTVAAADKSKLSPEIQTQTGDRPVIALEIHKDGKTVSWSNPSAPVTVSLLYTPTADELKDPEHIIVWYIDDSGKAVSVPSGRYDQAAGRVTFSITHFSKYAVAFVQKTFSDINVYNWAKEPIEVMASKGIINGKSKDYFFPAANITRADYLVLLMKTLGLPAEFDSNFADVQPGTYYYEAVGIAKQLGIATGSGNNQFHPGESISRQDMMVLTARALEKYKGLKVSADFTALDKFRDKADIAGYARESLAALVREELIAGSGNTINPRVNTARAEAAVFLYKVLEWYSRGQ